MGHGISKIRPLCKRGANVIDDELAYFAKEVYEKKLLEFENLLNYSLNEVNGKNQITLYLLQDEPETELDKYKIGGYFEYEFVVVDNIRKLERYVKSE